MRLPLRALAACALSAAVTVACSSPADDAPAVATPGVTLSRQDVAIGSPVDVTYRFAVAANAPAFAEDYWVFVHFLDTDGELMWTDDHPPPTPTRQWRAGSSVEYARTIFIPKFPYVGQTRVHVGLFSPTTGERLPLAGDSQGQRAYRVATFDLRLETDSLVVIFRDGWYETEVAPEGVGRDWQWSRQEATLSFRNPRRNVRLYLQADQPAADAFAEPQQVTIRIGDAIVDTFAMAPGGSDLRQVEIPAEQLGPGDTVDLRLSVDKTFVPASAPALRSNDPRELGIRVFRAFVEPA
jgi:hypothetical protein